MDKSDVGKHHASRLKGLCSGQAHFFRRSNSHPFLRELILKGRYDPKLFLDEEHTYYIECRNLHNIPRRAMKCAVAIKDHNIWKLAMLLSLPDEHGQIHYLEWNGGNFDTLKESDHWEEYEPSFDYKTAIDPECIFLNQINGVKPGGMTLKEDIINNNDGGIQCSLTGPDLLIPNHVFLPIKRYFSIKEKGPRLEPSITDSLPSMIKSADANTRKRKRRKQKGVSRRRLSSDHECVVYVQDLLEERIKVDPVHSAGRGLIPVPFLSPPLKGRFGYLTVADIKSQLCKKSGSITKSKHDEIVEKHAVMIHDMVVVNESMFQNHLSIRLIPNKYSSVNLDGTTVLNKSNPFICMETKDINNNHLLNKVNKKDDEERKGSVLISSWIRCKEPNHHDVTMDEINVFFKAYSFLGYGQREVAKSLSFVLFQGTRNERNRCMPSPVAGPGIASESQYYRNHFNPLYQPLAEKLSNNLAIAAESFARAIDIKYHSVIPEHKLPPGYSMNILGHCHKKIVTCGIPGKWLGYASCMHLDSADEYKTNKVKETKKEALKIKLSEFAADKCTAQYLCDFENMCSYGRKTTCVYQFVGLPKFPKVEVIVYFLMQGIGMAICFDSHISHSFFGHVFSHCTALPVLIIDDFVHYNHDDIVIFAWGGN